VANLVFASGERTPSSGLYQVLHEAHLLPPRVVLIKGKTFPSCAECAVPVRFVQVSNMPHLDNLQGCIVLKTLSVVKKAA
jgi:hypothetical protein